MQWRSVSFLAALVVVLSGCQSLYLGHGAIEAVTATGDVAEIASTFSKSELLFSSARKFEKAGQIGEAIKLYEKAASASPENDPDFLEANRHLAILYDLSAQSKKARLCFQVAMQSKDVDADLLNDYGYFLLKQEDFGEASKVLRSAHREFPQNERIATNLGMALVSSGRVEDGFRLFESKVGKNDAIANVGAILLQQGKTEEGKAWLQQVENTEETNSKVAQMLRAADQSTSTR